MRLSTEEIVDLFDHLKHGDRDHQDWLLAALRAWSSDEPIPAYVAGSPKVTVMLLWCPACGERHVDQPPFDTKPHHTHACQHCGMVWRPAIVPTVGVQFLPGFKDAE